MLVDNSGNWGWLYNGVERVNVFKSIQEYALIACAWKGFFI